MKKTAMTTLCLAAVLLVLAATRPALAEPVTDLSGCVYTINFKNDHPKPLTLKKISSRISGAVEGISKKQWAGATKIEAGKTYTMTIKTTFGCKSGKNFTVWYKYTGSRHSASRFVPKGKTKFTWRL